MPKKSNSSAYYLDYFESIQDNIKYILSFIIITNFLLIFLVKFTIRIRQKFQNFFKKEENIINNDIKETLLIIAHPDDESMFFHPTLKYLLKNKLKIRILCLSNGNFEGLGKIREGEFSQVMKRMKIEEFLILEDEKLKDGINLRWDENYVAEIIKKFLVQEEGDIKIIDKIGTIITFDENGVTKHPNHSACCEGLIKYLKDNKEIVVQNKINAYLLDSYNPVSQYTMFVPMLFFYFKEHGFLNINPISNWRLMKLHSSQFNFWRKLHVMVSSYSYYNTYTKLEYS